MVYSTPTPSALIKSSTVIYMHIFLVFTGAFLIPYVIMVFLIGFPLMYLEFVFGQYGGCGIVSVWKACPTLTGWLPSG